MKRREFSISPDCWLAIAFAILILTAQAIAAGPKEKVLHSLEGSDGAYPLGTLLFDKSGNLYGPAPEGAPPVENGTVFQLSPPGHNDGGWKETTIYNFGGDGDGASPYAGLIADKNGNLYGTTRNGGSFGAGTVFQLTPPAAPGGSWTETVLYTFPGGSGGSLPNGLVLDKKGNLYGTTFWGGNNCDPYGLPCGTVFELTPPTTRGKGWTKTVIYRFQNPRDGYWPFAGLVVDDQGNLYGTTIDGGEYTAGGLILARASDAGIPRPFIPIAAGADGTVFQLTPPRTRDGAWTKTLVHSFGSGNDGSNPYGALILDKNGYLYGTTYFGGSSTSCGFRSESCGTVFRLQPPSKPGGAWTETVLTSFLSGSRNGANPYASVVFDNQGNLYGTTNFGGTTIAGSCNYGCGVVFKLTPPVSKRGPWSETVLHRFLNGQDGAYPVAGLILDEQGNVYGTTEFGGSAGLGTIFEIIP